MRRTLTALLLLAAGCSALRPDLPAAPVVPANPAAAVAAPVAPEAPPAEMPRLEPGPYRIGPGDVIEIEAWNAREFTKEHTVGPDGAITLPVYGVLNISGKTREELAAEIDDLLSRDYYDPRVTVGIKEYNNNKFFVFGDVKLPGSKQFKGSPFLLEAFTLAGGLNDTADVRNCAVVRGANQIIHVDLQQLLRGGDRRLNIEIGAGDVVYVPKNSERVIYVLGEVGHPGIVPIDLGERVDVVGAILKAGSYTRDAATGSVAIIRGDRAHPEVIEVDLAGILDGRKPNIDMEAGDILYVSQRTLAKVNYFISQLTPSLSSVFLADQISRTATSFGGKGATK